VRLVGGGRVLPNAVCAGRAADSGGWGCRWLPHRDGEPHQPLRV